MNDDELDRMLSSRSDPLRNRRRIHAVLVIFFVLGGLSGFVALGWLVFRPEGTSKEKEQTIQTANADPSSPRFAPGEQEIETAQYALFLNRHTHFIEISFWKEKDPLVALPPDLLAESKARSELEAEGEKALNKKYGYTRLGLNRLNKKMGEAFGVLSDATKDVTKRHLEIAYRSVLDDLSHPSKQKLDERWDQAATRNVFQYWAKKAHTQIAEEIVQLEKSFWKECPQEWDNFPDPFQPKEIKQVKSEQLNSMHFPNPALRIYRLDKEAMTLFREGKEKDGFHKLTDALTPYKSTIPSDVTPDEALFVAVMYTRVVAIAGRSLPEQTTLDFIEAIRLYLKRAGISEESSLRLQKRIIIETVEAFPNSIPKSSEELFSEAFNEAVKLGEIADREEPEKTKKALAVLTSIERLDAEQIISMGQQRPDAIFALDPKHYIQPLRKYGLTAFMDRLSRDITRRDIRTFEPIARKLWDSETGAAGILQMMNIWGKLDKYTRAYVVNAINQDTPTLQLMPSTRDAISLLGGKNWLERSTPSPTALPAVVNEAPKSGKIELPIAPLPRPHLFTMAPAPRDYHWNVPLLSGYSSEWQKVGAVDVRVGGLSVTRVPILDPKERVTESERPMLVVIIEVRKNTMNKKRNLLSWRQSDSAIFLPDDTTLQPGRLPNGKLHSGLPDRQQIPDDGTAVRDILLFTVPSDDAGKLRLRLDAQRCGESGDIWFELPALSWKKK